MGSLVRVVLVAVFVVLGSVAPLSQAAVTGAKPAFDWTQFMKGVKRAVEADATPPATQEVDIDYQDSQVQIKPSSTNPMSPFLALKPALLAKPTFMPPFVDPQYSISKKTAFLGTLFNQLAASTPPPLQRRLIAPWLTTPPPPFDPKVMTDKKTAFLDKLFASFNTPPPGDDPLDSAALKPTVVPPSFWLPLPPKPVVKPTIVPPDFWVPFPPADTPAKPMVDPSVLIDKKAQFLNELMNSLATPAPPTEPTPTYNLTEFLDKLLEALTSPALDLKRSVLERRELTINAKDKLTDTFMAELTGIKNDMVDTATQMVKLQKAMVAPPGAKPGKKVAPAFAGLWGPMKPTTDPTIPLQEKMASLDQVFDMLTGLQKQVMTAVNQAALPTTVMPPVKNATNTTILDLLRKKLLEMDGGTNKSEATRDVRGAETEPRSIKMGVHQGYQSLPPGAVELLQAGGGSSPEGQEGGGITLQKPTANQYDGTWESRRHHHHD